MKPPRRLPHAWRIASVVAGLLTTSTCHAQEASFPSRPIRFIVGPGPDFVARLYSQRFSESWGQQVVVDQRPGGGGGIATEIVAKANPDGYTWLLSTGSLAINTRFFGKAPYDVERDLEPVALIGLVPFILVVHPALPARTVEDLVALARTRPGQLNYASGGTGTAGHLCAEMLKSATGIDLVHVPYKTIAGALTDIAGGQVQMMFGAAQAAIALVRGERLRALAISSARRFPGAPDIPTMAESGVPGFEFVSWSAIHVPRRTPRALIARINARSEQIGADPAVRERMISAANDPAGGPPEALARLVRSDLEKIARVIKEAGIRAE